MSIKMEFPYVNPNVRYVGTSELRKMTKEILREQQYPIVIKEENGRELVVVIPWKLFLGLQER